MTKYSFVYEKIKNCRCSYRLKNGYVSLTYYPPIDKVFCVYHPFDDYHNIKARFIFVRSAVNRVLRNYSSFSFS